MKTKNRRFLFGFLLMAFVIVATSNLNAQITIGLKEKPEKGTLLQLKNIEDAPIEGANANKGLLLPRVGLTDIRQLYPMFPIGYDKGEQDKKHTGLTVYNTNATLYDGDGQGIYLWDGEKWYGMGMIKRSIKLDKSDIYLSENSPTATAKLTVMPENAEWNVTESAQNICSMTMSADGTATFTREPDIYGDRRYTFTLKNSSRNDTVYAHHLNLYLGKELVKVGENGEVSTTTIKVEGGRAKWVVNSYTKDVFNWLIPPENKDGKLHFKLGPAKDVGDIEGSVTVSHIDDPNYTKTLKIQQNKEYIMLPAFDYLVVRYNYAMTSSDGRVDLDTSTEINGTGEVDTARKIEGRSVGWNQDANNPALIYVDGKNMAPLQWGGDNTQNGYETVYTNMTILRDVVLKDCEYREFNVDMYGNWYSGFTPAYMVGRPITVTITLYKGGQMQKNGYDYIHIGDDGIPTTGHELQLTRENLKIMSRVGSGANYRQTYTPLLRLIYDKEDNTGLLMRLTEIPKVYSADVKEEMEFYNRHSEVLDEIILKEDETKEELSNRLNKTVSRLMQQDRSKGFIRAK